MEEINDESLLLEALSDKVLHQLPPSVWKNLFLGEGRNGIVFEQRPLTLVHVDAELQAGATSEAWEKFCLELQRLAARHQGRLDPYVNATALITFEDPGAAVRMGIALQRAAAGLDLRIGISSGPCVLAFIRAQGRLWCTPLGAQPERAAQVAASAAVGGIVISPETQAPGVAIRRAANAPASEFQDSEINLSGLATPAGEATGSEAVTARH
ncbi:MAG: adenylate cyclase-like protein [Ramlibacter sp.]|nr:adenylate cyclase-like protein [Ramlibacter sp.]